MTIVHELLPTDVAQDDDAVARARSLAHLLAVLGDPTRLAILSHLRGGEHRVGELASHLGLAQSTVSQHLEVLRGAGLISTHAHGRAHVSQLEHADELTAVLVATSCLARAAQVPTEGAHA
ncbi:MAG: metalloregulator ArsR/SmtB family transcription factor [Actinomyces urogenitalis]|jgi:DNA-binding transcriptional ArsR family regulator|uniref:ArsR family transcriptional regulator n=2 Tax=Actinomyces urogenitalis TaxID=103621 RepID=A0A2I1KTA7_9ACTO|nr:metalloregulator ArsR/SmtB family transcription factor [Actinomyces urogenitalis]ETJ02845.1 MAG: ArsR family regulatory protein [Actinomyces urogenitalis DORA_12]KGE99719.1 ArsR family transcriptional regulator [Actinomyces urogenitalis S6-C4]MBS5976643.1 winged helix-turn-helix transcriptional regulator [Actinomyces urogenitalis]MBS6071112.1 winged helix-turn-helix transcriptional regulator [Actinomyces urogenitalis]MDK8237787.1 metalloregulator ArsR/SmtB family transcription factor [Actin